ncbi:MAG: radical SAM protein [Nanoarchaeota archaeon]
MDETVAQIRDTSQTSSATHDTGSGAVLTLLQEDTPRFKKVQKPLRIHFIMPPISLEERYGKLKDMGTLYPSLGMAAVAAICEVKGHTVKVTDGEALSLNLSDIRDEITSFKPDFVGMPTFATNIDMCHTIARISKEINPHAKVMLGGAHTSIFAQHALSSPHVDFGIQSEAEIVFDEFLDALDQEKDFTHVKGLVYKDSTGTIHVNPKQKLYPDLNQFPIPARHLFPMEKYHSSANLRGKRTLNMMTSRGCPYRCTYCSSPQIFGQSFRYLNTENVMKELRQLRDVYGADSIQFYDETFTVHRQRVIDLCEAMIKENLNMQWACFTRANLVDKELLKKMKEAGCYLIFFGLESGVQRLIQLIKKDITLEQSRNAVKLCKEAGIQAWCSFILGLPGETKEESQQTVNFALELDPEYVQFPIFMPWPGTAIYDIAKKHGVILNENLSDYTAWDKAVYKPHPDREPEEVQKTVQNAYRAFYLRPSYIARKTVDLTFNMPLEKIWKLTKAGYYTLF